MHSPIRQKVTLEASRSCSCLDAAPQSHQVIPVSRSASIPSQLAPFFYSAAHYHHEAHGQHAEDHVTALSENRTRYEIEGEYTALRGLVPRLSARLFPGVFTKQAQTWLGNFKVFAEGQHVD